MLTGKEPWRMTLQEISDLMELRGWNKTDLASALHVKEHTVHSWLIGRRNPSGPACILMRMWLEAARGNGKNGNGKGRKTG